MKTTQVNIANQTTMSNSAHQQDTPKTNKFTTKSYNKTLMSLMIWSHKRWTNPWWVNNHNLLKTSRHNKNNNSTINNNNVNKMFITRISCRLIYKLAIMYQDQSINTINRKLRRFLSIGLYHLLACHKKILRTLIKLWRKGWTSLWWVINHKPVSNIKLINNQRNKKNNNFAPVKYLNTI